MSSMLVSSLLAVAGFAARALAEDIDSDMGPAAFLFPPDRAYSASLDNTAPCGSVVEVTNRTDFPLTGGFAALVDQEEAYDVSISISYSDNPTSLSDFEVLISSSRLKEIYEGHTCVTLPDAPSNISVGDVATLQVTYESVWDTSANQTFYACADITYITDADFTQSDYCFNATVEDSDSTTTTTTSAASGATSTSSSSSGSSTTSSSSSSSSGSKSKGISHGAIAGAVVGSVVGAAVLVVAGWFLYRLGAKNMRTKMMRQHMNTMALGDLSKPTGSVNSGTH